MTGSGTPESPYIITTVDELQSINDDLTAYYELGNDIDASATSGWNAGAGFEPIGTNSDKFTGSFDGNKCVISNLSINRPEEDGVGLFGVCGGGSVVKRVGIESANIIGGRYVGALVGHCAGDVDINESYSTGFVAGDSYVGGLVGYDGIFE